MTVSHTESWQNTYPLSRLTSIQHAWKAVEDQNYTTDDNHINPSANPGHFRVGYILEQHNARIADDEENYGQRN